MLSVPTTIKQKSFDLRGYVSTGSGVLQEVTGSIINSAGKTVQTQTTRPYQDKLNIQKSTINKYLKFASLAKGKYTLKIYVADTNGKTKTYKKTFTVN